MSPTQRDRVYEALVAAGDRGVCGSWFLGEYIPRYSAVIYTLRHDDGHLIIRRRCTDPAHHHVGVMYRWVLVPDPVGTQLVLGGAS